MSYILSSKATKRLQEVVSVFIQEDFTHLLYETHLIKQLSWIDALKTKFSKPTDPPQVRLRRMFEKLGPTYIKIGQLLSTRPDLLPSEYITELEKLQSNVPAEHWSFMKSHIETQLGKPLKKVFKDFEEHPLAAGSIAQVYKATLNDGTKVAVKVQRPGINEQMLVDFEVLHYLAGILEKNIRQMHKFHTKGLVTEIERYTREEFDFVNELKYMQTFSKIFSKFETIRVPTVYPQYSSKQILVMEYIKGKHIHQLKEANKQNIRKIFEIAFQASLYSVFEHGIFHADPHPGNFLVTPKGTLVLLDFGIVGHFDSALRKFTLDIFSAAIKNDDEALVELLMEMGSPDEVVDHEKLRRRIRISLRQMHQNLGEIQLGIMFEQMIKTVNEANLKIPTEFVLFAKMIITSEGIARTYSPDWNLSKTSETFIQKMIEKQVRKELSPERLKPKVYGFFKTLTDIPASIQHTLRKIERGNIKINIEDTDIKHLSENMESASRRLSYSILAAAFVLAGASTAAMKFDFLGYRMSVSGLFYLIAAIVLLKLASTMKKPYKY